MWARRAGAQEHRQLWEGYPHALGRPALPKPSLRARSCQAGCLRVVGCAVSSGPGYRKYT